MKRWKKALSAFVVATVMGVGVAAAAGCNCGGDDGGETKHKYETTWAKDASGHWHNHSDDCECDEEEVEVADFAAHDYTDDDDMTCNTCGWDRTPKGGGDVKHKYETTWSKDASGHWHAHAADCECGKTDVAGTTPEAHKDTDDNGKCDTCEWEIYAAGHIHKFEGEWKYDDEKGHYKESTCTEHTGYVYKSTLTNHDPDPETGNCECGWHNPSWTKPSIYDKLSKSENNLIAEDFKDNTLPGAFSGTYGKTGVYLDEEGVSGRSSVSGGVLTLGDGQETKLPGTDTKVNVNVIVDFGPVKGTVEGYFEFKMKDIASSGNSNQVSFVDAEGKVVLNMMAVGGGNFGFSYGASYDSKNPNLPNHVAPVNQVQSKDNTTYKVYYKLDLTNKKITLEINDTKVFTEQAVPSLDVAALKISTSNGGKRGNEVDNIAVCGTLMDVEDYAEIVAAKLATAYGEYDLEKDYTKNGDDLKKAYEDAKAAINAAKTIEEVDAAYEKGLADMAAILNDADQDAADAVAALAKAKEDAIKALDEYIKAAIAEKNIEDDDTIGKLTAAQTEWEGKINGAADKEAVDEQLKDAKSAIDTIVNSAGMDLGEYKTTWKDQLGKDAKAAQDSIYNDTYKGKIGEKLTEYQGKIEEAADKGAVDTQYNEGKKAIEDLVAELQATKFDVTFADSTVAKQEVLYGTTATRPADPAKTATSKFIDWYTSDALTDLYNFDTPVYDNVTIYAKWQDADVTINYYVQGKLVKTVKAYSDEKPEILKSISVSGLKFVKWCSDSELSNDYVLPANWTENQEVNIYAKCDWKTADDLKDVVYVVANKGYTTDSFAAGVAIEENELFEMSHSAGVEYSEHTNSTKPADAQFHGVEAKVTLDKGLKDSTAVSASTESGKYKIVAKEDIKVYVYLSIANNTYNSHKTGTVYYTINGGEAVTVQVVEKRDVLVTITKDLKAGDEMCVYFANTGNSDAKMWLWGVCADLADTFTNASIVFHDAEATDENGGVYETVAWSSLKSSLEGSAPATAPSKDGSTFKGWSKTVDGEVVDFASLTVNAGETLHLYPVYDTADGSVTMVVDGQSSSYGFKIGENVPDAPAKEGYKFVGWYEDEECETTPFTDKEWKADHDGKTLYAKYEEEASFELVEEFKDFTDADLKGATSAPKSASSGVYKDADASDVNVSDGKLVVGGSGNSGKATGYVITESAIEGNYEVKVSATLKVAAVGTKWAFFEIYSGSNNSFVTLRTDDNTNTTVKLLVDGNDTGKTVTIAVNTDIEIEVIVNLKTKKVYVSINGVSVTDEDGVDTTKGTSVKYVKLYSSANSRLITVDSVTFEKKAIEE